MKGRVLQIAWLAVSCAFVCPSCREKKATPEPAAEARGTHDEAVREFLSAPKRFQEVVGTIRDEASYDRAAPGLEEVVRKFRDSAAAFRNLAPPGAEEQAKYRTMIADGFRGTEPTGEEMLSLTSIKSREKEVAQWMKEFMSAGQEAGAEALRLYGKIDYPDGTRERPTELDFGEGKPVLPSPPPRRVENGGGRANPLLEHLGSEPAEGDR